MLSEVEAKEMREKIIAQIESSFPAEKIAGAKQQIEAMNNEEFENFLEKNGILKEEEESPKECVFCAIASGKIQSSVIEENKGAIAVLEINPISKGHSLIVAKIHDENPQKDVITLTKKISSLLKKKLKPKSVEISQSRLFGHEIVNLLPVYSKEDFKSERKHATTEELNAVKEELLKKKERKPRKKRIITEKLWLPKRIP
jgi:diadenosine tetraphosphate (Ap4A) HIT family hydrolase